MRAAAKNHARVTILSDPAEYPLVIKELSSSSSSSVSESTRQKLALKAFSHTADYDESISGFFREKYAGDGDDMLTLRYGAK